MKSKLGRLFLTAAMGPVAYAGRCIMARKVKAGLGELTTASLMGAVERGAGAVAKEVGLPAGYVTQLLPTAEMDVLLNRIDNHQHRAKQMWDLHTGHIGGLLDGVADLTVDGRAPDTGLCLLRLSRKMRMDKELAEPLSELSDDLERWQEMLTRCRAIIDDGRALRDAYRKRRMLQLAALAMGVLVVTLLSAVGFRYWRARARVDALLLTSEPCSVEEIDAADLSKASATQTARAGQLREQCEAQRDKARKAAEAERQRKEQEARRRREAEERTRRCQALATALQTRSLNDEALAAAPGQGPLLKRMVAQRLKGEDVAEAQSLPCRNSAAAEAVDVAFARAVLASSGVWIGTHSLSTQAFDVLVAHKDALPEKDVNVLAWVSEDRAKKAVSGGKREAIKRAAQLCRLAQRLALSPREDCQIAVVLAAKSP